MCRCLKLLSESGKRYYLGHEILEEKEIPKVSRYTDARGCYAGHYIQGVV